MSREAPSFMPIEQILAVKPVGLVGPAGPVESVDTLETIASTIRKVTRTRPMSIALVIITLGFEQNGYSRHQTLVDQSIHYYLENLRSLVRKTDNVFLFQHSFYFVLQGANLSGGAIVQERLWDALVWRVHNTPESNILRPCMMMIGHSAYPAHQNDIHQCINMASLAQRRFESQSEKATLRKVESAEDRELPELARKLGVPYLSFLPRKLPQRVRRLVSPVLAQELHCFPIGRERDVLTVAMSDPQDSYALERLRQETGLTIFPVLAHPGELQTALEQL